MSLFADTYAVRLDGQMEPRKRLAAGTIDPGLASTKLRREIRKEQPATSAGISNLQQNGQSQPTLGTIGFYALLNGVRRRELMFVSNRHVLLAGGGMPGSLIYPCSENSHGVASVTCGRDPIACVSDAGEEAHYTFTYPGEDSADYFIDCATARLLHSESLPSASTRARRPARIHPLDVAAGRSCRVRKTGSATGMTEGNVIAAAATVRSGGTFRARNLVIRGVGGRFAEPGDSGALLVNVRDEAVGLLWGRDDNDPDIAYACHIHPVLDRLGVTMVTRGMPCGIERMGGSI